MDSIKLKEKKNELLDKIEAVEALATEEKRSLNEVEQTEIDGYFSEVEKLKREITLAEKIEKAKAERAAEIKPVDTTVQKENKEERDLKKSLSVRSALSALYNHEQFTGAEAEAHQEAVNEMREFKKTPKGFAIPSWMMNTEKRTDIDQATSAIAPTEVGAYVDGLRENAIHTAVGIRPMQLTGDYKIPIVGSQSLAWATAENSAAADGGANFTSDTLTPFRLTGFVDVSNEVLLQNGNGALEAVMRDLGRETANKIDAAMFSTASVSNAPPSLGAKSGILTFTEATYTANASILSDLVEAEQTLAENQGLSGNLRYVCAPILMGDLKKSAQVASVIPAMEGGVGAQVVNGYPINFTVACTNATASGDGYFGNFDGVVMGYWGGMDMSLDPYSVLLNDQVRIVVHRHVDWGFPIAAKFVKFTSLTA